MAGPPGRVHLGPPRPPRPRESGPAGDTLRRGALREFLVEFLGSVAPGHGGGWSRGVPWRGPNMAGVDELTWGSLMKFGEV